MNRIYFHKNNQRLFLDLVMKNLDCPALINLPQYGLKVSYSSLKNYYSFRRLLPEKLFLDLCFLAKINKNELTFEIKKENWGQVIGGKKSKRTKSLKNS
jgi:hypothetical protein